MRATYLPVPQESRVVAVLPNAGKLDARGASRSGDGGMGEWDAAAAVQKGGQEALQHTRGSTVARPELQLL